MARPTTWHIAPPSGRLDTEIWAKINEKTKPVGALGKLEALAFQIARVQETLSPSLTKPTVALFAGDHGIAASGLVNPYPQEVSFQMVMNILQGGAAINALARTAGMEVQVIDAGVNFTFEGELRPIDAKLAMGTADYRTQPAMSREMCQAALQKGAEQIDRRVAAGSNVIGFGEMGIGNSSSAALLMSAICQLDIAQCVGKGTGAVDAFLQQKIDTLKEVVAFHQLPQDATTETILATFGGFEIVQMVGAMLQAAAHKCILLVDGFISTAALLAAARIHPAVKEYAIFTHLSEEQGHLKMLNYLEASAVLRIDMRLGEGTGCAAAYPLLKMAVAFFNEMASFASAKVSKN